MIKAVIFDLDDTLISELEYIKSGFRAVAKYLTHGDEKEFNNIFNQLLNLFYISSKEVFNRYYEQNHINYSKQDIIKLINIYRNHRPEIKFYNDVLPFIEYLKQKRIKTGIISDGLYNSQRNKIETLNANKYFDYIILTDKYGKDFWKPSIKCFKIMKEYLNVNFEEMVYIGDNLNKDFINIKKIGLYTIQILRNNKIYKDKLNLDEYKAHIKIKSLKELSNSKILKID